MPNTAIFDAIREENLERVKELIARDASCAAARNDGGVSAVLWALYHRRADMVAVLQAAKPSLDLFEACALGDAKRVGECLAQDPSSLVEFSPDGYFPLGLACFFGRREVVSLLLERGADIHTAARNPMKVQSLHAAAAADDAEICRWLLDRGADPNARQQMGWTPFQQAVHKKNADLVRLMLAHGADPRQPNDEGKTALDLAVAENAGEIRKLLEAK